MGFIADKQKLDALIYSALAALGYEYIGYEQQGKTLVIYIDCPEGITIEDCGRASKQISAVLDVEDVLPSYYRLEVSSPGFERPLFCERHYAQFVGHKVRVKLFKPRHNQRNFVGTIAAVVDGKLTLALEDGRHEKFLLTTIAKARLEPEFEF